MDLSQYFVLVVRTTPTRTSDAQFVRHSRVPFAILNEPIRPKDKKLRQQLNVLVDGKPTKIDLDQVVVSRVHLPEFDPAFNPAMTGPRRPYLLPWPDSVREHFDKAVVRQMIQDHAPHIQQPDFGSVEYTPKGVNRESHGVLRRFQEKLRSGQAIWIKPTNGYAGRAILRVHREGNRLWFKTDDKKLEKKIQEFEKRGTPDDLPKFLEEIYIPHLGDVVKTRRLMIEDEIVGEKVPRASKGKVTQRSCEQRFPMMRVGSRMRVTGAYAKVGGVGITANRSRREKSEKANAGEDARKLIEEIYRRHYPGHSNQAIGALTDEYMHAARNMAHDAATVFVEQEQKFLDQKRQQGQAVPRLKRTEISVDIVPVMKWTDASTSGEQATRVQRLVPHLGEINAGRIGLEGYHEVQDPAAPYQAYDRHMELRTRILEDLWRKAVSERRAKTPETMIQRRRSLDDVLNMSSGISVFTDSGEPAESARQIHQVTFRPVPAFVGDARRALESMGLNVTPRIQPANGGKKEMVLHVTRGANQDVVRNFDWFADNMRIHAARLPVSEAHRTVRIRQETNFKRFGHMTSRG